MSIKAHTACRNKKLNQSEVPHRSIALRLVPSLGWGYIVIL